MAISINPQTRVIFVPKADLTLIQSSPTEIRELNLNSFRLWLKDWEDSEEGRVMPDTHRHNTEVTVGGLTLARVIEIINDYTVTFEDGTYAVNLVAANSNVGDVVNVNNVSVRSSNSAGLVNIRATELPAFLGGVTINTASSYSGTLFPVGTKQAPVNNLTDAKLIANVRGVFELDVQGTLIVPPGEDLSNFILHGANALNTNIIIMPGVNTTSMQVSDAIIASSTIASPVLFNRCSVANISNFTGGAAECVIFGTVAIGDTINSFFLNCISGANSTYDYPTIDLSGGNKIVSFRNWSGPIKFINSTNSANLVNIEINSGSEIIIESSCTAGTFTISGIAHVTNNGTATVVTSSQMDKTSVASSTWAAAPAISIITRLTEVWGRLGLDQSKPLVSGQTSITFGDIVMALTGNETSSTLTRV